MGVFDEFPYLAMSAPELPSILQRIVDMMSATGNKIIICGSSQRMMQGFVLKYSEPLYGRAREILPIRPLSFRWMKEAFPKATSRERLELWAVYGGVPRYWALAQSDEDVLSGIRSNIMNPLGILHDEPQTLLIDEVGDLAKASSVLCCLSSVREPTVCPR